MISMKKSTKYLRISINIALIVLSIVFFLWILPKVLIYFMPFVIAAIIAFIANPFVRFLEKKVKITRKAGTVMLIVLVIALVVTALYFILYNLIAQMMDLIHTAPQIWESTSGSIRELISRIRVYLSRFPLPVREWSDTFFDNISVYVSDWLSAAAVPTGITERVNSGNIGYMIVSVIMGILASYFFLADRDKILGFLEKHLPANIMSRWELVMVSIKEAVGGYFTAQFKIMGIIYVEVFAGLMILGVKYSFLIAFLIALLDFLPFFGTGTVMIPWAVVMIIQQNYKMAIGLLIVWAIGQAIRQLIQPKLVGDSIGLAPIPTLFLLYIGFRVGGPLGLIIAVPIGMVIINLYKAGVFSNFKYSMVLLFRSIENMRKFTPEELKLEGLEPENEEKQ